MSRTAATEAEGDDTDDEIILVAIKKQRQGQEKENDRPDPESSDDEDQDDEVEDVKKALLAPPQRVRACRGACILVNDPVGAGLNELEGSGVVPRHTRGSAQPDQDPGFRSVHFPLATDLAYSLLFTPNDHPHPPHRDHR